MLIALVWHFLSKEPPPHRPTVEEPGSVCCFVVLSNDQMEVAPVSSTTTTYATNPATRRVDIDFGGRRVLVTGAARGIGLEIAKTLAMHNARVIAQARTREQLNALMELIPDAIPLAVDLTDFGTLREKLRECAPFDALVNNAGTFRVRPTEINANARRGARVPQSRPPRSHSAASVSLLTARCPRNRAFSSSQWTTGISSLR